MQGSAHAGTRSPAQDEPAGLSRSEDRPERRYSTSTAQGAAQGRSMRKPPPLELDGVREGKAQDKEAPSGRSSLSRQSSARKWHETGVDSKRTVHVIANPIDGLLGIQTEIPNPAHPSARGTGGGSVQGVRQKIGGQTSSRSKSEDDEDDEDYVKTTKRKEAKTICFVIPWVEYDDLPDLPRTNILKMSRSHPLRRLLGDLAMNPYLEAFWLLVGIFHFMLALPEFQDNAFRCNMVQKPDQPSPVKECAFELPFWHHFLFFSLFWLEIVIKSLAFGFTGGKFAHWTADFYNKADVLASVAYIFEIALMLLSGKSGFSFRGLRLLRFMKPLGQLGLFSDLETIFHTIGESLKPMATVLALIGFVMVLFCIIGMSFWGQAAFRRRCVWADDGSKKMPEQYCERGDSAIYDDCLGFGPLNPVFFRGPQQGRNPGCSLRADPSFFFASLDNPELGLDGSCGPFQLCLDIENPNYGFSSYDSLSDSLITLIQVISGDNDVQILWASINAKPYFHATTAVFYLMLGFLVIHVFINVLVAVFANVFASSQEFFAERNERRRQGKTGAATPEGSEDGSNTARSQEADCSDNPERKALQNCKSANVSQSSDRDSKKSRQSTSRDVQKDMQKELHTREENLDSSQREEQEDEEDEGFEDSESARQRKYKQDLELQLAAEVEEEKRRQAGLQRLQELAGFNRPVSWVVNRMKKDINPSLQALFIFVFRNPFYDLLTFATTLLIAGSLCCEGSLCIPITGERDCYIDPLLNDIVQYSNIFFTVDVFFQVVCDGSLSAHFESGEHVFNFLVNIFTTLSVVMPLMGVAQTTVAFFRNFAILRLLRGCKFGSLRPIWLMLVKATGALEPVMNLVLFNTVVSLVFYQVGRYLFGDNLNSDARYNFSSISRGYMTLITVMTGDGWSSIMYHGMSIFCTGTSLNAKCDPVYKGISAAYFTSYWFYGQFLFVTMFLAIILEAFAVEEFMEQELRDDDDKQLTRDEVFEMIADFQGLPVNHVSNRLVQVAWQQLSVPDKETISRNKLMILVRMVQPMTQWRLAKALGLVKARETLRRTICFPFYITGLLGSMLKPYPGDSDYIEIDNQEVKQIELAEAEAQVAREMENEIRDYMYKLSTFGILGEVLMTATRLGILDKIQPTDLRGTAPLVSLKLLYEDNLGKRLGIDGMFKRLVQEAQIGIKPKKAATQTTEHDHDDNAGLNLAVLEQQDWAAASKRDTLVMIIWKRYKWMCYYLVDNRGFDILTFSTIITSSIFLCLEPPHPSMPSALTYETLRLWDMVFNFIFVLEAVSKIGAYGLYIPSSIHHPSYLQVTQNRLDALVLTLALIEMSGGSIVLKYIGAGTMKMIRLMKVMRPLRLLMRSEGLKIILDTLFSCRKPIFYATLFLLVVCAVFAVLAMALFKKRFWSCNDGSFDGLKGEGEVQCVGTLWTNNFLVPRTWDNPPTGQHFDTFTSSVLCLMRCLTLSWGVYWMMAQDAYEIGYQPVLGYSMIQASAFFHLFVFAGSFFGLNLFAGFVCDTFYSIQGTEQLEEVQWMSVKQVLRAHQPRTIRHPPKNIISAFMRAVVQSFYWQTFSAACLLMNVGFMASTSAEQSLAKARVIDIQNDVFFAVLCVESFFNLLGDGPVLYITTPSNQFDLFLITCTTITIVIGDSLRSISQAVRILRLSKFLRALSKHPTISAVFETVAISMGQVVNIVVVLFVVILIFSALAVQLFGLVKSGSRLGFDANFMTFQASLHTCIQLMFGEDMHALTDDCSVSYPSCTPNVLDPVNGEVIFPGDCGNQMAAVPFFWFYLVMTQFVMLNLFVGMIMNNFAFITTKDGNGVLEEEDFINMAYIWVEKFDPKVTTLLPLPKVYQFFHAIGAPLGHYGEGGNNGRFHCVREELKRILEEEETLENSGSWVYRRLWLPLKDKMEVLTMQNEAEWRIMNENVQKLEDELLEAAEDDVEVVERMGLLARKRAARIQNMEEDPEQEDAVGSENSKALEIVQEDTQGQENTQGEVSFAEETQAKSGEHVDLEGGQIADAENEDPWANVQGMPKRQTLKVAGGNMGWVGLCDRPREEAPEWSPPSFPRQVWLDAGEQTEMWLKDENRIVSVHGGNMGVAGVPPKGRKKIKRQMSNYAGIEKAMQAHKFRKDDLLLQQERINDLEKRLVAARRQILEMKEPVPTPWMQLVSFVTFLVSCLLSHEERVARKPGHVRYNEVIMTLMYWNKERNIVPSKNQIARRILDEKIITDVSFQLLEGLVAGAVVRRRNRKAREMAQTRFQLVRDQMVGKKNATKQGLMASSVKARKQMRAKAQDDYARNYLASQMGQPSFEIGHFMQVVVKILAYGLASGSELAEVAEEADFSMGKAGIFMLEEMDLRQVITKSSAMRTWTRHVDAIDHIRWFVDKSPDNGKSILNLLTEFCCWTQERESKRVKDEVSMSAKGILYKMTLHKVDLGRDFEKITTIPLDQLLELTHDPYLRAAEEVLKTNGVTREHMHLGGGVLSDDDSGSDEETLEKREERSAELEAEYSSMVAADKSKLSKMSQDTEELKAILVRSEERLQVLQQDIKNFMDEARRAQRDDAQSESECPTDSETESENIRSIAELPREEDSLQDNVEGRKDYQEVDDVQMTDVDSSPVKSLTYSWIDEEAQLPGSVDPDLADTGAQAVVFPVIKSEEQDGELSKATVRPATADLQSLGWGGAQQASSDKSDRVAARPATASVIRVSVSSMEDQSAAKIQDAILFANAEIERLERLLRAANKKKKMENEAKAANEDEASDSAARLMLAKDRRAQKENPKAESETLGGVLTSPRDKAAAQRSANGSRPRSQMGSRQESRVLKKNKSAWAS